MRAFIAKGLARRIVRFLLAAAALVEVFPPSSASAQDISTVSPLSPISPYSSPSVVTSPSIIPAGATPYRDILLGAPGGRSSMAGWLAHRGSVLPSPTGGTMKVGQVLVTLSGGLAVGYNTNINAAPHGAIGDMFVSPSIGVGLQWLATQQNQLALNLGLTYTYYLQHPKYNTNDYQLSPNTFLKYSVYVGDFVFTLYDAPTISSAPTANQGVSNTIDFSALENSLGLSILWDVNRFTFNAGINLATTYSLNDQFQSSNSNQLTLSAGAFYQALPNWQVGVNGEVSPSAYTQNVLNNYVEYELGLVIRGRFTHLTSVYAEFGGQLFQFSHNGKENADGPIIARSSSGNSTDVLATAGGGNHLGPYFDVGISNQLNRYYSQNLAVSYNTQNSSISNYTQTAMVSYSGQWRINRKLTLGGFLSLQDNIFSGSQTGSSFYTEAQLGFNYSLFHDLPVNVTYLMINQLGREHVEGYVQSIFTVGFSYTF